MRVIGLAVLSLSSLGLLAGCSTAPRETRAGFEALEEATPGGERAPMAALPAAAGAVVAVLQAQAHEVLTQRIVLRGDADALGENALVVKVDRSRGPEDIDGKVGPPTRAMIAAELDEAFAGVDMRLSQSFYHNSFGPFGYAVGHPSARVTCVYAWEWGLWKPARLGEAPAGAVSMPTQPTSVRARLCRSSAGEAEIVDWLKQMQVFPYGSQLAYVDPNYRGGEGGDALASAGVGYFDAAPPAPMRERLEPPKPRARKHAHRRHRERLADMDQRAVAERPVRDDVAVPMPGAARVAPAPADNPLLAPLSAAAPTRAAAADDLPLPGRVAPPPAPSAAALIPLPN